MQNNSGFEECVSDRLPESWPVCLCITATDRTDMVPVLLAYESQLQLTPADVVWLLFVWQMPYLSVFTILASLTILFEWYIYVTHLQIFLKIKTAEALKS